MISSSFVYAEGTFTSDKKGRTWTVGLKSWTIFSWRNDQDFDPSQRYYDPDGQSQGQFVTALRPTFNWASGKSVSIFYEPEIGWESWGAVNSSMPHPYGPNRLNGISMRHRQLWSRYQNKQVRLTAGYQPVEDPSELFMAHLAGSIKLDLMFKDITLTAGIAQLPEDQFEGLALNEDNFSQDSLLFSSQIMWKTERINLQFAGLFMRDNRVLERALALNVASFNIKAKASKSVKVRFAFAYQGGSWENSGLMGVDQTIRAWGSQGGLSYSKNKLSVSTRYVLLSGDDQYDGNAYAGGFFYSGRNDSSTLILTQDEFRDRFDNLDERNSTAWGSHFVNRAGLGIWDINIGYQVHENYHVNFVYGVGWVLAEENMLGESLLGSELALVNIFPVHKRWHLLLHGQIFIPQAAGIMINDRDREARQNLYGMQAGVRAKF